MSHQDFIDSFHGHRCLDSNRCVELGVSERLGDLPDPSAEAADQRTASAGRLLATLDSLSDIELSFDDRLDLELARLMLEAEVFDEQYEFNGASTGPQQPRAADAIGNGLFMLSVADPRPAPDRLRDITSRVEGIPRYLEQLAARLERPVSRWAAMDRQKVAELPTLLSSLIAWAEHERWSDAPRLARAAAGAREALSEYERLLSAMPTVDALHVGEQTAARIVKLRGIEQDLGQLHAMAKGFLLETRRRIDDLRATLCDRHALDPATSAADLQHHLNRLFRVEVTDGDFEQVLDRYRREHEQLVRFINTHRLFPLPDDQSLQILATPGFMRPSIPAGAMTPPAPFRSGTATSLIFLTLSEELLDEHTELSIPIMMVHEGIPGHHLQLATASKHPSRIRRHVMANDHAEGWTTMLEGYMLDRGYLTDNVEEARFCALRDLSRIGARVAIDLFFMTGQRDYLDVGLDNDAGQADPFAAAGTLLQTVTGFAPSRVQAELNWYSQERGYPLSYLTGNQLVERLRADHAAAHPTSGAEALDRVFFERYLTAGNMPLSFLRRVFEHTGLILPA